MVHIAATLILKFDVTWT